MSDFAFNNYCIHCDKLCLNNSVYCSEECKSIAYESSLNQLQHNHSTTSANASAAGSTSSVNSTKSNAIIGVTFVNSSLIYTTTTTTTATAFTDKYSLNISSLTPNTNYNNNEYDYDDNDDDELNYFDLNYSVQSNINYTTNTTKSNNELINSTSDNYRKWLTAL